MKQATVNTIGHFLDQGNTIYLSFNAAQDLGNDLREDNVFAFHIVADDTPQFPERPYVVIYSGILTETNLKDYYKQKYEDEHQAYENLYTSVRDLLKDF